MKFDDVYEFIKNTISDSCGIETNIISPKKTLFNNLGITSIDIIDILYEIEMEYDISLKISDIEKQAKIALNGKPFSNRGILTKQAIDILKKKYPELATENLKFGISEQELINLITVEALVNMVLSKVKETKNNNE